MNEVQEYLEIMAGRKRLELEYKSGDIISGYTAHGLHARIIENLHCGQFITGWGFLVDREFEDGDIMKMKRHFYEWQEMEEERKVYLEQKEQMEQEEKERLLQGVSWSTKESFQIDGSLSYIHHMTINGKEYTFCEQKIAGMGKVIQPQYEICKNILGEPLPEYRDGHWYWSYILNGKEEKIQMEQEEERAYQILLRYGKLQTI